MVSPESVATPAGQTPVNSTSGSGPSNGVSKACTSVSETSDSRGFLMDLNKMRPPRIPSDSPAPLTPLMAVRSGPASRALQLCIWAEVAYSGKQTKLRSLRHAAVYFLSTQQTGGATAGWALASWLQSTRTGDWDSLPGDVGEKLRLLCDGEVLTLQSLNDQTVIKLDGHALHKAAVDIVVSFGGTQCTRQLRTHSYYLPCRESHTAAGQKALPGSALQRIDSKAATAR